MSLPDEVLIRDAIEEDMPFFFNSILHHYKHSSPHTRLINDQIYYRAHQKLISKTLERKNNVLKFAALKDDPKVVFGFLWANLYPETLHYVYIKKAFRNLGLAKHLYFSTFKPDQEVFFSHLSYDGGKIICKYHQFMFNPYLLHGDIWKSEVLRLEETAEDQEKLSFLRPML